MVHKYYLNGMYIVMDINSGSVHVADELTYRVLDYFETCGKEEIAGKLSGYAREAVFEAYDELHELKKQGLLYSADNGETGLVLRGEPVVKALCLHVAHACNLRCVYCFAGDGEYNSKSEEKLMNLDTGKAAIDFLIKHSGKRRNLEIDFFGGEPLLNFDVVKQIVEYAREQEGHYGKNFRFTITTNGLLLDDERLDYINRHMQNIVLSIDGRREVNDRNRKKPGGGGSYDDIVPIFIKTAESRNQTDYYVRGTYTAGNLDFCGDVTHLADLGFRQISVEPVVCGEETDYALRREHIPAIFAEYEKLACEMLERRKAGSGFNFFHFMIDLTGGPCLAKRVTGCGAGTEYLAVSPNGDIYPCHQFTGMDGFHMGSVFGGIENTALRDRLASCSVYTKDDCRDCFAKFYCSGGCAANAYNANGDFNKPYVLGCELQRKRVECAVMIKAAESEFRSCGEQPDE